MDSQTRTTRSAAEVTKTKTFRSKALGTMKPTRAEDVSNIEAVISLISNSFPLDPYLWAGTMIFFQFYQNVLCKTVLLHSLIAFLEVGKGRAG